MIDYQELCQKKAKEINKLKYSIFIYENQKLYREMMIEDLIKENKELKAQNKQFKEKLGEQ